MDHINAEISWGISVTTADATDAFEPEKSKSEAPAPDLPQA